MRGIAFLITMSALLLVSSAATAQEYIFKVLGTKGSNQVDGSTIRVGTQIKDGQTIQVGEGAYLGLVHHSKKTIEIKKSGSYKVSDLEKKVNTGTSDLAGKYAQFILEELTADGSQANRYRERVKTGSVTRGTKMPVQIMMPAPESNKDNIVATMVTVKWYLGESTGIDEDEVKFKFSANNLFGTVIYEKVVDKPEITLDFNDPSLKDNRLIEYQISVVGKEEIQSEKHALKKSKSEAQLLEEIANLPNDSTAISKLILARYFEQKELFANAIHAYEEALSISDLEQYKELYDSFLYRNVLSAEARKAEAQEVEGDK